MTIVNCSQKITWEKLAELAKLSAKSGKESTDFSYEGFAWGSTDELVVDDSLIDASSFQTAINAVDTTAEGLLNNLKSLREKRDKLLAETDWMGNSDVAMSDEWKTYRQNLRDLPTTTSDPSNPTWPVKPS